MRTIITIVIVALSIPGYSQCEVDNIISSIEQNNSTLRALRKDMEATTAANHTGLTLEDPEIEFAYMWGSPSAIGGRKNLSVTQSLDMATLSGAKKRLARQQDVVAGWRYKAECRQVMLEARQLCIDVIYYNAMLNELRLRHDNAAAIAVAQKKRLDNGEATRMEYNGAMLDLASAKGEMAKLEAERSAALALLQGMNGGNKVVLTSSEYPYISPVANFDTWYADAGSRCPALVALREEVAMAERQIVVSRSEGMPKLTAGFMGEYLADEKFQGITVGISIPLWSNRGKVRQAKAQAEAAKARHADVRQRIYANIKSQFLRQAALRSAADTLALAVKTTDNTVLLKKALDAGSISVTDYLLGSRMYYEAKDQEMEAMRQWHRAWAELTAFGG